MAVVVLLATASPSLANPATPEAQAAEVKWTTPWDADMNQDYSQVWYTTMFGGGQYNFTPPWLGSGKNANQPSVLCSELAKGCSTSGNPFVSGVGAFELCSVSKVAPCLESLEFQNKDGVWQEALFQREVDVRPTPEQITSLIDDYEFKKKVTSIQKTWGWESNPKLNVPGSASGPMVFRMPGRKHLADSDEYSLNAVFNFTGRLDGRSSQLGFSDFQIALRPIVELECEGNHPSAAVIVNHEEGPQVEITGGSCLQPNVFTTATSAAWGAGYAEMFPIRVNTRLPKSLGGWFQGRAGEADVTVDAFDPFSNKVAFSGTPVEVPVTTKQIPIDLASSVPIIEATCKGCTADFRKWQEKGGRGPVGKTWSAEDGIAPLTAWSRVLGKKARGSATLWTFSHFSSRKDCMGSKTELQGLVTTNAMVYQPDTPSFKNGVLSYQVGGLHLNSNGEVFEGIYNFKMRSSVAKCLYGFKGAAIGGSVTVTSSDGKPKLAVTSVGESNGWLRVTALGFSFSNPIIKVRLNQAGFTPIKRTITCTRGGKNPKTQKVSGVFPVCPDGFTRR